MNKKIIIGLIILIIMFFFFIYLFKKDSKNITENKESEITTYNSNIIKDVNYIANDVSGNTYIIDAKEGEIDINNSNIIYLTDVTALIKLNDNNNIDITSKFGKYNISSFDTIFSKNVIIKYLDNKITGEYLDFSINRNSMIISRDVIYTNKENMLESDVVEVDIKTKDTKIFMHNVDEKVNIKSIN